MSDWQKVRVTFQDADGNEVSVPMWANDYLFMGKERGDGNAWKILPGKGLKSTLIRELPTGVGAVIRVTDYNDGMDTATGGDDDVYVRGVGEFWTDIEGGFAHSDDMADWRYEVLSEGTQIGDVK